jgi:hypothetical protein
MLNGSPSMIRQAMVKLDRRFVAQFLQHLASGCGDVAVG